jgi:hypothetical protein
MAKAACFSAPSPTVWKPPTESSQQSPNMLTWVSQRLLCQQTSLLLYTAHT